MERKSSSRIKEGDGGPKQKAASDSFVHSKWGDAVYVPVHV
jgi:hypothetical protein